MFRSRILPLLIVATACSDDITGTPRASSEPEEALAMESIPGILESPHLLRSGETRILLVGWQTALFRDLVGAEVLVDGVIDTSDGALIIHEFMVLSVDGFAALDGRLDRESDGFAIRSLRGAQVAFSNVPEELANHVGKRVWVTMAGDGTLARYGLLEM